MRAHVFEYLGYSRTKLSNNWDTSQKKTGGAPLITCRKQLITWLIKAPKILVWRGSSFKFQKYRLPTLSLFKKSCSVKHVTMRLRKLFVWLTDLWSSFSTWQLTQYILPVRQNSKDQRHWEKGWNESCHDILLFLFLQIILILHLKYNKKLGTCGTSGILEIGCCSSASSGAAFSS